MCIVVFCEVVLLTVNTQKREHISITTTTTAALSLVRFKLILPVVVDYGWDLFRL